MTRFTPFDAADYLDNEETIAAYLSATLEEDDPEMFLVAIKTVARARGMTQLAKDTGLSRESLYRSLSGERVPSGDTLLRVIHALGFRLGIQPQTTRSR